MPVRQDFFIFTTICKKSDRNSRKGCIGSPYTCGFARKGAQWRVPITDSG
jgi:hypothetical protein